MNEDEEAETTTSSLLAQQQTDEPQVTTTTELSVDYELEFSTTEEADLTTVMADYQVDEEITTLPTYQGQQDQDDELPGIFDTIRLRGLFHNIMNHQKLRIRGTPRRTTKLCCSAC